MSYWEKSTPKIWTDSISYLYRKEVDDLHPPWLSFFLILLFILLILVCVR